MASSIDPKSREAFANLIEEQQNKKKKKPLVATTESGIPVEISGEGDVERKFGFQDNVDISAEGPTERPAFLGPEKLPDRPSSLQSKKTIDNKEVKKEATDKKEDSGFSLSKLFESDLAPALIATALGGLDAGFGAAKGTIAAKQAEAAGKAAQAKVDSQKEKENRQLAQKDRELDIKEDQVAAAERAAKLSAYSKLVDAKIKDQKDFQERFVGSKLFGNFTSLGSGAEAAKLREKVSNTENIVDGLNKLISVTSDINTLDRERIAIADQEIATLVGKLRIPITGPGAFTDSEREFIKEIIGDPTKLFGLESIERIKLQNLIERSSSDMRNILQNETVEGAAQLKAYQQLKQRGYTDEQINERLGKGN